MTDNNRERFLWQNNRPHWKRAGDGFAEMNVVASPKGGWLSIDTQEVATDGPRYIAKRTMITMSREEALRLRDLINTLAEG